MYSVHAVILCRKDPNTEFTLYSQDVIIHTIIIIMSFYVLIELHVTYGNIIARVHVHVYSYA